MHVRSGHMLLWTHVTLDTRHSEHTSLWTHVTLDTCHSGQHSTQAALAPGPSLHACILHGALRGHMHACMHACTNVCMGVGYMYGTLRSVHNRVTHPAILLGGAHLAHACAVYAAANPGDGGETEEDRLLRQRGTDQLIIGSIGERPAATCVQADGIGCGSLHASSLGPSPTSCMPNLSPVITLPSPLLDFTCQANQQNIQQHTHHESAADLQALQPLQPAPLRCHRPPGAPVPLAVSPGRAKAAKLARTVGEAPLRQ
eukprot:359139-Chlamydomonas_euryale.AAC.9